MAEAKRTPLYATHVRYGGRMIEFGGWSLPVQYTGIKEEHHAVRTKAGLFDVSHMGEIIVEGPDALMFLQKLVTNDISRLAENQVQYTPMCYSHGGTVDDLLVYKFNAGKYLLVVNAANTQKDWEWICEMGKGFDVRFSNVSDDMAQLALQGPAAEAILEKLTAAPLSELKYYWFIPEATVAGRKALISRTGYTGEDGFEIYCRPQDAEFLWEAIITAGKPFGLLPAGLGCRDTLRFEACLPLYGHELSEDITPLEAGLAIFVKLKTDLDFVGRPALAEQKAQGLKRKIAGFAMIERGVARAEYPVLAAGRRIGTVTSGTYSPTLDKNLGLALIEADYAQIGQRIGIEIRGKEAAAEVIGKPFYKRPRK